MHDRTVPTRSLASYLLLLMFVFAAGCSGPAILPDTPNVLRDGAGSKILAELPPEDHHSEMKVLYITDREPFYSQDKGPIVYGFERSPSVAFGMSTVTLDPEPTWDQIVSESGSDTHSKRLLKVTDINEIGRVLITPASMHVVKGHPEFRPSVAGEIQLEKKIISDMVESQLALTKYKDVYIYVHGVDNSFDDSMTRAAVMWHYLGRRGVMLAYAWPSGRGGLLGYFYDRESGEFTVMHLKRVLQVVSACKSVERIHIIAHSRGCDVSTTALRELNIEYRARNEDPREKLKLQTLVLAAADLDAGVFSMRLLLEDLVSIARRMVIYSSSTDKAVGIADRLFSSRNRLGTISQRTIPYPAQKLLGELPNVQIIDCSVFGFGNTHDYLFTNPGAFSDLILLIRDGKDAGILNGRPLTSMGGAFWKLDNTYALPPKKPEKADGP